MNKQTPKMIQGLKIKSNVKCGGLVVGTLAR